MGFIRTFVTRIRLLRQNLPLLYIAWKDKRTPAITKMLIGFTGLYFISPIDIIPDVIPVLGFTDELFIVPGLIQLAVKTIPAVVVQDAKLRMQRTKSRIITTIVVLIILAALGLIAFYTYQYFTKDGLSSYF